MTIQTQIDRISTANQNIKTSIVDSGVAVPEGTKLDGLAPLVGGIVGQFSDDLDLIIGADTTPIPDAISWADKINGEDVSGGSEPVIKEVDFDNPSTHTNSYVYGDNDALIKIHSSYKAANGYVFFNVAQMYYTVNEETYRNYQASNFPIHITTDTEITFDNVMALAGISPSTKTVTGTDITVYHYK